MDHDHNHTDEPDRGRGGYRNRSWRCRHIPWRVVGVRMIHRRRLIAGLLASVAAPALARLVPAASAESVATGATTVYYTPWQVFDGDRWVTYQLLSTGDAFPAKS